MIVSRLRQHSKTGSGSNCPARTDRFKSRTRNKHCSDIYKNAHTIDMKSRSGLTQIDKRMIIRKILGDM